LTEVRHFCLPAVSEKFGIRLSIKRIFTDSTAVTAARCRRRHVPRCEHDETPAGEPAGVGVDQPS